MQGKISQKKWLVGKKEKDHCYTTFIKMATAFSWMTNQIMTIIKKMGGNHITPSIKNWKHFLSQGQKAKKNKLRDFSKKQPQVQKVAYYFEIVDETNHY